MSASPWPQMVKGFKLKGWPEGKSSNQDRQNEFFASQQINTSDLSGTLRQGSQMHRNTASFSKLLTAQKKDRSWESVTQVHLEGLLKLIQHTWDDICLDISGA